MSKEAHKFVEGLNEIGREYNAVVTGQAKITQQEVNDVVGHLEEAASLLGRMKIKAIDSQTGKEINRHLTALQEIVSYLAQLEESIKAEEGKDKVEELFSK